VNSCRVSVVLPTRNRLQKLRRALASVYQQTFNSFEIWLVDDGSGDGTAEFLGSEDLLSACPAAITVNVLTNASCQGAASARNRAMRNARGEYLAFLDDDDEWLPDFLERQVAFLDSRPEHAAVYAPYVEVDASGRLRAPDLTPLFHYASPLIHLFTESFVHSMSVLVCRRAAIEAAGLLDEDLSIVHDLDWYARLLLSGARIAALDGPPLVIRCAEGGLITRHRDWFAEERGVLEGIFNDHPEFAREKSSVIAHRALFFFRVGLRHADYRFAVRRLGEALWTAPMRSFTIVTRRLIRRLRPQRSTAANTTDGKHSQS